MPTYLQARQAEGAFREFRELALAYWNAAPPDNRDHLDRMQRGVPRPETEQSQQLREQLCRRYPQVTTYANSVGVPVGITIYPPAHVKRPAFTSNLLFHVTDQYAGYTTVSRQEILDCLDRCIGAAQTLQRRLFWRQFLNPLWYVVEVFAYVIRIPFLILRRAGLPAAVEGTVWAHFVKALLLIAIVGACAYWGIKVTVGDVLQQWLRH